MAGYKLLSAIRAEDEFVPLIMESTEADKSGWAEKCGAHFIDKNSKKIGGGPPSFGTPSFRVR